MFLNRRAAAPYRALASIKPGQERFTRNFTLNNITNFGDQNGIFQWKSTQINLMMLAWGNYNMPQDFINPVIDN